MNNDNINNENLVNNSMQPNMNLMQYNVQQSNNYGNETLNQNIQTSTTNQNNNKKNVIIIVLMVIVVGLISYITYEKFMTNKESCKANTNTKVSENNNNNDGKTADERYKEYITKVKENYKEEIDNYSIFYNGTVYDSYEYKTIEFKAELKNNIAYITDKDNGKKKISDNVVFMFATKRPANDDLLIWIVKEDGYLYLVDPYNVLLVGVKSEEALEKYDKKNIVSVFPVDMGSVQRWLFIDIDGNMTWD